MTWPRTGPTRIENVTSWEECSSRCREKQDCKYWTWFDGNNRTPRNTKFVCVTMTNAQRAKKKSNTWSGTRDCGGEILNISSSGLLRNCVFGNFFEKKIFKKILVQMDGAPGVPGAAAARQGQGAGTTRSLD